jgi:type VI secretion system protein ImpL
MLQPLLGVLRLYTQMGFARSGGLVAQCARDAAGDALGRISVLANQSRLYEPEAGPADGPVLVLGTTPVVRDYLARQVARAQVVNGYADPFTALLRNTSGVNDAQSSTPQTLTYWTNTIHELTRYVQFKDPAGQVGALDALFLKTVSDLTYANCAKSLAAYQAPEYGDDLFSARRRLLVARVTALCGNRQAAQSVEAFRRLAERFNAELAGRYPFGSLDAGAPEAGLGTVKAFFLDYDAQRAALDQALAGVDRAQWREAFAFIERLDAVSAFLRGSLTAPSSQPLRMAVTFRALPNVPAGAAAEVSPGSNQIVGWSLSAGSRVINYPGLNPLVLDWPYGQAIELDLNWADRSLWRPVETPAGSALVVRGTTASLASSGNWALLRMLERFAPRRVPAADPGNPNRALLEFTIPVVRTDGNAKPGAPAAAVTYLGLDLSAADPKTQSAAPVRWPGPFPRSAPEVPQPHPGAKR